MTRKESLLKQFYEIENASATLFLNREAPYNIEKMEKSGTLSREAQKYTQVELEEKVAGADRCFQSYRRKSAHEAWLKTPEGEEAQKEYNARLGDLKGRYLQAKEQATRMVNEVLALYGSEMYVRRLDDNRAEIGIGDHQFNSFDLYYDNESYGEQKPEFNVNVGCTGSFELDSDRCRFYAQMGSFLASVGAYTVRQLLLDFNKFASRNRREYIKLRQGFETRGTENL